MDGPLGLWAEEFANRLDELGYAEDTRGRQLRLAAGLSAFMDRRGLVPVDLCERVLEAFFVEERRRRGTRAWPTSRSLMWLLEMLRESGGAPPPVVVVPVSWDDVLIDRFVRHLRDEQGLVADTVAGYALAGRSLLTVVGSIGRLVGLNAASVSRFVQDRCRVLSGRSAERLVSGLRSFLRFLLVDGVIVVALADAVPSVARWSQAGLPRGLSTSEIEALLIACDRDTPVGRRDYAIIVLLARLGLRAAEAAGLRLDDINWRAGEIIVRGKGNTEERLPLPADVGAAIADYLRQGRPRRPEREVFLRCRAPIRGLAPEGLSEVVRAASERAGLGSFGAHRLRHTAATSMLNAGASLTEVAQVLRHRNIATTAIYAKVDHRRLRELCVPWPGVTR